jgi:hypothetical protein
MQESKKFIKFFEMVQEEARKRNCIFFCDCGLGDVFENDDIECENLCGWLIPEQQADKFESIHKENSDKKYEYDAFYCSVDFIVEESTGKIRIDIDDTPDDLIVDDFGMIQHETEIK